MRNIALALTVVFAIHLELPREIVALDQFKMLDLQIGEQRLTGRVFTHNDQSCWFLQRDGRLQQISMDKVTHYAELDDRFKAHSQLEMKSQLQAEFGKSFEVRTVGHYVVAARQGTAEKYAVIFERIYREFVRSFRARGLDIAEPEFPMVAIVFPDATGFVNFCKAEKVHVHTGLLGYYLPASNRVAMFERSNSFEVDPTVIHEATHQVAFNTGIHSRLADHPKWVVEGLATVFEAEGVRSRQGTVSPADRVNRERYLWFQDYMRTRRPVHSLASFVSENQLFETSVLDAYSEAWALSFFLLETRPADYSRYLKSLVERDPLMPYEAESRLEDFTTIFGTDLDGLEAKFLRFIKRIADR